MKIHFLVTVCTISSLNVSLRVVAYYFVVVVIDVAEEI